MSEVTRRSFVGGSAAGLTALAASAHAAGRVLGSNDTIRVGFIGVGNLWGGGVPTGRCQAHIDHILRMTKEKKPVQAVAVCDVFNRYRDDSAEKIDKANAAAGIETKCKKYSDYRELLADKDIDVVCIATPDHWHTLSLGKTSRRKGSRSPRRSSESAGRSGPPFWRCPSRGYRVGGLECG